MLTNDVVSFEQPGPEWDIRMMLPFVGMSICCPYFLIVWVIMSARLSYLCIHLAGLNDLRESINKDITLFTAGKTIIHILTFEKYRNMLCCRKW